jgi:hypothetical protein
MITLEKQVEFRIAGGLGNQLFMLCAGIHLSERSNIRVKFDISELTAISKLHPGENVVSLGLLENFETISGSEIKSRKNYFHRMLDKSGLQRFIPYKSKTLKVEEIGYFDLSALPLGILRIEGYFQTWKLYSLIKNKPKITSSCLSSVSDWYSQQVKTIEHKNFAAIHVRRGDYLLSKNRINGVLSRKYYENALKLIPDNLELLIFTDSPQIVRKQFKNISSNFRILEPPIDSDPVESLLLMSQASHLIISNSTFSWWAAAYSHSSAKIYAPTKWFELRNNPVDLYPNSWITVQSEWEIQK